MSRPAGLTARPSPMVITAGSFNAIGPSMSRVLSGGVPASGVSPWSDAANSMLAFPFWLAAPTTIYKVFWVNGSAAGGNSSIGIYDAESLAKLVECASTAGSGNSVPQAVDVTDTTIGPGMYYAAMAHDATTTNQLFRWSTGASAGAHFQALGWFKHASVTLGNLPATATPADLTNIAVPLFGVITRSVFDV